ncbi:Rad52/22 family double-strand break repair protein-domain-containing protein [Chlamydoabsidia padenii]|nr:Rad52/22 family double-strand break repair protein-domain-containing protein [Chlamydoabsidia padenii]
MTTCLSIGEKLNQRLGPEWISDRSGPGGGKLQYIEGHSAINIANEIFGYDGWSSVIKESVVDFVDVSDNGRVSLGISTTVRITIKHSDTVHEDIGYGSVENMKSKADAFEKARKESATDGLKRALRKLGNALGLCLYDKSFTRHIKNMARTQVCIKKEVGGGKKSICKLINFVVDGSHPSILKTYTDKNISGNPSNQNKKQHMKYQHLLLPLRRQ